MSRHCARALPHHPTHPPIPPVPAPENGPPALPATDFSIREYLPGSRQLRVRIAGDSGIKTAFVSGDALGLGSAPPVKAAALATLDEYTVGSCGPRGFYGTTRKHLELETALSTFLGTPETISYSDGATTTASVIPAFAKRGDVLLVDAGVSGPVWMGAKLSRSKTLVFKHNDMGDLRKYLEATAAADKARSSRSESLTQRRFIVVEGLYTNYGDICPLPQLLSLAAEFKWRVVLDDSCGLGVLGRTGRGTLEHYGLTALDVDVLVGSLSGTLASVGGFCTGPVEVVDHQRLSSLAYCFSASSPPFLCATATAALGELVAHPELLQTLRARAASAHAGLSAIAGLVVVSSPLSPVVHLHLQSGKGRSPRPPSPGPASLLSPMASPARTPASLATLATDRAATAAENETLHRIVTNAAANGVLLSRSSYLPTEESTAPRPSLRVCVTAVHTEAQIKEMCRVVEDAVRGVLGTGVGGRSLGFEVGSPKGRGRRV